MLKEYYYCFKVINKDKELYGDGTFKAESITKKVIKDLKDDIKESSKYDFCCILNIIELEGE